MTRTLLPPLTPRETQICRLVVLGQSNKTIAAALKLAPSTVKEYLGRIFLKTRCHSRTALAVCFVQGVPAKPARPNPSTDSPRGGRKKTTQ